MGTPERVLSWAEGSVGAKVLGSVVYCYVTNAPKALGIKTTVIFIISNNSVGGWAQLGCSSVLYGISWSHSRGYIQLGVQLRSQVLWGLE